LLEEEIVAEGLCRAPELRKQKWTIKRRELELIAQRNYLKPQLDLEGLYRFHGLGKDWIDSTNKKSNAVGSMTRGDHQNWGLGLKSQVAVGFRREMAAVRNAELALARERAILQEQELELVHNLSDLFREVDRSYRLIEDYLAVLRAARKQVRALNASFEGGKATLYEVLQAQQQLAQAETDYYRMVIEYNMSIVNLNFRKGSLLEYNGITLAEGPWANKAYFDAWRRARERDAAKYVNYGFTSPQVVSRGRYQQFQWNGETLPQAAESYQGQGPVYDPSSVNASPLPQYATPIDDASSQLPEILQPAL
ncbi:MAG: TolC family protein, partial [Thermoguttaceae bacterium]|nr:TolC family protein [Thermoguttaceae bacterium]